MGLPTSILLASVLVSTLSLHICTRKLEKPTASGLNSKYVESTKKRMESASYHYNFAAFLFRKSSIDAKSTQKLPKTSLDVAKESILHHVTPDSKMAESQEPVRRLNYF